MHLYDLLKRNDKDKTQTIDYLEQFFLKIWQVCHYRVCQTTAGNIVSLFQRALFPDVLYCPLPPQSGKGKPEPII